MHFSDNGNDVKDSESYSLSSLLSFCEGTRESINGFITAMNNNISCKNDDHGTWGRHATKGGEGGDGGCQQQVLTGGKIQIKKRGGGRRRMVV